MKNTALEIVKKLRTADYEAYWVGGCVRDLVRGKKPHDFDIATSAKPEEIEKLFSKTVAVGKKFGVILVVENGHNFEVATFRGEKEYSDARRPEKVFWTTAENDAKRRDFTCNALFFDPLSKKYLDFVDGKKDIEKKILRFIGNAEERISEDHLRILRAIRFKNILGFDYEEKTKLALQKNASLIKTVSAERIRAELDRILKHSSRAKSIQDLSDLGILPYILPEAENMKGVSQPPKFHAEGDVFVHTIIALEKLPPKSKLSVAWAVLLHDIGKTDTWKIREHPKWGKRITFYGHIKLGAQMAEKLAKRLKFSRKMREKVVFLVREHLRCKDLEKMKEARQRRWAQLEWFLELLEVWKADGEACIPKALDLYNYALNLYQTELKRPRPPKPFLNGNEVMKILKIKSGPRVGEVLENLVDAQLEDKVKNKAEAEKFIKK